MPVDHSSRILGVSLSPIGNFSDAINKYRVKADGFAARLKSPRIGHTEEAVFHRSIYIPSMRYGLAAISASRNTDKGSRISSPKDERRLILLNLQYLQLEAGIAEGLLANPGIEVLYLTPSWLISVRDFLATHNMLVTLTDQPTIQTAGPTVQFIIQSQHLQRYSKSQQMDINLVRIYLQVNTLADMTDELQPNRICLEYLDGMRPHGWTTTMRWPKQLEPSKSQRRLWKRFITSSYL